VRMNSYCRGQALPNNGVFAIREPGKPASDYCNRGSATHGSSIPRLQALKYLHSQQIAHRDIKPANILLMSRKAFCIKLADFGLSKDTSMLRSRCVTCLYIAPEIWSGYSYTAAVDIWSLGLVVFRYAYGLPEYGRSTVKDTFDARLWNEQIVRAVITGTRTS